MFLLPENQPVDYNETALYEAMRDSEIIREGLKDLGPVWGRTATAANTIVEPLFPVAAELNDEQEGAVIIPFPKVDLAS